MDYNPVLRITWAKAFGEIYCHHASLCIPSKIDLFSPEIVCVGVIVRNNMVLKGVITHSFETKKQTYLPCIHNNDELEIQLNSAPIIEALSLNSWTILKGNRRGTPKEYPIKLFYKIDNDIENVYVFNKDERVTPYVMSEHLFKKMNDGEEVEVSILLYC